MAQDLSFDMRPTEVSQEILDGFKTIPTATVYNAVRHFSVGARWVRPGDVLVGDGDRGAGGALVDGGGSAGVGRRTRGRGELHQGKDPRRKGRPGQILAADCGDEGRVAAGRKGAR